MGCEGSMQIRSGNNDVVCISCSAVCRDDNAALESAGWGLHELSPQNDSRTGKWLACAAHKDEGTDIVGRLVGPLLEAAIFALFAHHGTALSTRDIACGLGKRPRSTIREALSRLERQGKLQKCAGFRELKWRLLALAYGEGR